MFELLPINEDGVVGIKTTGMLFDGDYQSFAPGFGKMLESITPVRALLDREEFQGWEEDAAAHSFHFRMAHRSEFERVAALGAHRRKKEANKLAEELGGVPVRSFPVGGRDEALAWLSE